MAVGHFVWTDLSTYDMQAGRSDYAAFFGWAFEGDRSYDFALSDGEQVAALFEMPSRLAEMKMPSFWMSYVHVDNVAAAVAKARQHEGVVIEVEPQAFQDNAHIALVRDPSGAGFTLYEGPDITPTHKGRGTVQSRFHHVSDISLIQDFYADLFGWAFEKATDQPWPTFDVRHPDGTLVACVEEVPESVRGTFKYWMPCFEIGSHVALKKLVTAHGGEALSDLPDNRTMFVDRQGAHFLVRANESKQSSSVGSISTSHSPITSRFAWKAMLGLVCVWFAAFLNVQAFWGILFLVWTWPALRSGRADFVEPVTRRTRPLMYWAIIGTWLVLSLWLIAVTAIEFVSG